MKTAEDAEDFFFLDLHAEFIKSEKTKTLRPQRPLRFSFNLAESDLIRAGTADLQTLNS